MLGVGKVLGLIWEASSTHMEGWQRLWEPREGAICLIGPISQQGETESQPGWVSCASEGGLARCPQPHRQLFCQNCPAALQGKGRVSSAPGR